ncbi:MAG TPA: thrombospondin type 3 repeat-containing protein, partial [Chthoniobacterales bacterium]
RGFAYGANIGWLQFEASGNPRLRFTDGALEGYAYGANVGWINLGDPSEHFLKTNNVAMGVDSDGDGIADAFEYQYFGGLAPTNMSDSDGDGVSDLNEYLAGTNPLLANDHLRITAFSTNAGGTSSPITWRSTTARLYTIETSVDLSPLSWVTDTTFSYPIAPDAGNSTTRTLIAAAAEKRYYRVRSIKPLP